MHSIGTAKALSVLAVCAMGCGGSEPAPSAVEHRGSDDESVQTDPQQTAAEGSTVEGSAAEDSVQEIIVARIVDRGPLGDRECVQQSYEVEPDEGEPLWIHFEQCGAITGGGFEGLQTGTRYRFTVERGASPNFADDPMILDAQEVP